jgi:hypothetical protein
MTTLPIAPPRQRGTQERFIPQASRRIASVGELLPLIGDVGERVAAGLLHAERLETRTGRWCPDLELPTGSPAEVKLVGPTSSIFLHESQVEAFAERSDYQLVALFHRCPKWRTPTTDTEAQRTLLLGLVGSVVVPGRRVKAALASASPCSHHGLRGVRLQRRVVRGWYRSRRRFAHRSLCPELAPFLHDALETTP